VEVILQGRSANVPSHSTKNPLFALLVMGAVGGMFAVAGLPSYAPQEADAAPVQYAVQHEESQSLVASSSVVAALTARDGFTATTPEELAAQKAAAARALLASYVPSVRAPGDDYPWAGAGGLSPLRYYAGECVDFVAWRLNRDVGSTSAPFRWTWSNLTPGGGSATNWTSAWQATGRTVSNVPVPGSVAVTDYYHVAYVRDVNADGTVLVEEYNYGNYHQYGQRVIPASSVLAFLYPPG
jgi:surface antigen